MRRHRARAGGRASGTPRVDPARLGEARLRSRSRGAGGARKVGGARSEAAQTVSIVMPSVVEAPGRSCSADAARRPCDSARLAFDHEVEVLVARAKWAEREAKRL